MNIQLFENDEFQLRITPVGDSFTVEAPGLARALGFREAHDLVKSIPDDEKGSGVVRTPGGDQQTWHLTEPGLYRAIGQRQAARIKNQAVREQVTRFQNWVYREVLPAIRRTGGYSVAPAFEIPRTFAEALELAARQARELDATRETVRELEPSAAAWNTLATAAGDYSVREAAQILDRDPVISTGQNRLFASLRQIGWIDGKGKPYQAQVDVGRLVCRPTSYTHPHHGEPVLSSQIRVTVKGLKELRRILGEGGQLALDRGA